MVNQVELIGSVMLELDKQGIKSLVPRQFNTIIRCVDEIIREIEIAPIEAKPGMGLYAWLASDDVGLSSKFMASVLSGSFVAENHYPLDASDFARCIKMLDAVPELREHLPKLHDHGAEWSRLVRYWSEAEEAYRNKDYQRCGDLVRLAIGE